MALTDEVITRRIFATLGIRDSELKGSKRDKGMLTFDAVIRNGIPYSQLTRMKAALNLTDDEFANYLGISLRTLQRKRNSRERLSITEGDRLYRMARIFALTISVLEDEEMAKRWLHRPQRGLGGRVPIEVIQTEAGGQEVEDLLEKIEFGVLV